MELAVLAVRIPHPPGEGEHDVFVEVTADLRGVGDDRHTVPLKHCARANARKLQQFG